MLVERNMIKKPTILIAGVVVVALWLAMLLVIIEAQSRQSIPRNSYLNPNIQVKTYKGKNGWGYDIYVNNKLLIHQPDIPALSGNRGFPTKTHAQRVAELVVDKIRKNILPPSITKQELKDIGVAVE